MVWKGLNLHNGGTAVAATDENMKLNPVCGIRYSLFSINQSHDEQPL